MKSSFILPFFFFLLVISLIPVGYSHPYNLIAVIKTGNATQVIDLQSSEGKKEIQKKGLDPIIISLIVGIPAIAGSYHFYLYKTDK